MNKAEGEEPLPPTPSLEGRGGEDPAPSFSGKGVGGLGSVGPLLGIDYGTKRIGLAVCDPDRVIASPLTTTGNDPGTDAFFADLVARSKFVGIVVGLPLHANGDESAMSREARTFAKRLGELTKLPFVMWDERCTSAAAEDALFEAQLTRKKRKARVDRVAAQMILQSFIDADCPAGGTDAIFTAPSPDVPPEQTSN